MAAYAALLSLGHILDHISQHPPRQMAVLDKAQIDSLLENITFLQNFLEEFSLTRVDEIQALEEKIARSAYAAEDIIECRVVDQILEDSEADTKSEAESSSTLFRQDLQKVIEELGSMKKDAMKIKGSEGIKIVQPPKGDATAGSSTRGASSSKNNMVGFDEDLIQIMERLTGDESNLQIHSVVGMGGIGKTTLVRHVFNTPLIVHHFDLRAWVTISQQYSVHEILSGLLKAIGVLAGRDEEITQKNDNELRLLLHRSLFNRRYLIVMDDIWSIEAWDGIKRFIPDNDNGSRVLVTTRLSNVADNFQSCTSHKLRCLDNDKSWTLFCDKVFEQESCPPELEEAGKKIVRNCWGLPLAIVAISGLLSKSSRTVEYWEYVANDTHTAVNMEGDGHCFGMLSLSYKHLPVHLKPCFLYMAMFPEDSVISISRLIKLWVAEGILKPIRSRSLEEIAEDNLKDLVHRNLVRVHAYGTSNKIKTCTIHDLLRDLCLREAQKEKFIFVATRQSVDHSPTSINDERRLIINRNFKEEKYEQQVFGAMNSTSCTRSLICCSLRNAIFMKLPISPRLLRLLNMDDFYSYEEVLCLVNLRYIAFKAPIFLDQLNPLKSLSSLWNLQTIHIAGMGSERPLNLPAEIWEMPQLRHLKRNEGDFHLPDPPSTKTENGSRDFSVLKNLQTLYNIRNFRCTDMVIRRIPNIKNLGITYRNFTPGHELDHHEVNKLVHLCNLESLLLNCDKDVLQNLRFPHSLKELTLSSCRLSWEDLTLVGSLPHLEVLKLKRYGVQGPEWNPVEGEFLKLKLLQIKGTNLEEWIADSSHFPRLENLVLQYARDLKKIPCGIGEIQTLKSILLEGCSDSANSSAKEMQEEQRNLGNDDLQVHVHLCGNWKQFLPAFNRKRLFSTLEYPIDS